MNVLVAGATGRMGGRVAAELARAPWVQRLRLTGRDEHRLAQLARVLGGREPAPEAVPGDVHEIAVAATRGVDLVVSCAGPAASTEEPLARASVDAGASYVSLNDDLTAAERVWALDGAAVAAGVTVVPGCGLSPGITDLLLDRAATELGTLDEVAVTVALSAADIASPAAARRALGALSGTATYLSGGRRVTDRAGGSPHLAYLPEPVGWVETVKVAHPGIVALRRTHPEVSEATFRLGLTERAAMDALRAAAAVRVDRAPALRRLWTIAGGPARALLERLPGRAGGWSAARVDVWGHNDGRARQVTLGIVDRLSNLATVTLVACARRIAAGGIRPGVLGIVEAFAADELLGELDGRGIRAARLEPIEV